jgi:hypothetical protein
MLKWPMIVAALTAAFVALIPAQHSAPPVSGELEVIARVDMREAMRILHDEHDRVLDQADRKRAETEQQAAEDSYAFEQARLAAIEEAARKLAEQRAAEQRALEQRAAEKRVAEASLAKDTRKPKPEPVAAAAPLDIVPVTGGESGPLVSEPRGPIEMVVAKVGGVAGEIKNKAVAAVTDIKGWFSAAGDKLLGR